MSIQALLDTCLAMPHAWADTPFGPEPVCVRVGRRIFAEVYFSRAWVTFRCEPAQGLIWRGQYPEHVRRGYHCPPVQHPYSNTITLDGTVPDAVLLDMLSHSYQRVLHKMTRAERDEALNSSAER